MFVYMLRDLHASSDCSGLVGPWCASSVLGSLGFRHLACGWLGISQRDALVGEGNPLDLWPSDPCASQKCTEMLANKKSSDLGTLFIVFFSVTQGNHAYSIIVRAQNLFPICKN